MGFSFGDPVAPLTPPLSPEFSRRTPAPPKLQGRSAQAIRDADSDSYEEDDEDIAMREYHGRRAPPPKESLLDLLNSAPPGWTEDPPPSPARSTAPSAKSSKSARFIPSSLRGFKGRGSSRNQAVGEPLRGSKSSHELRGGRAKAAAPAAGDFSHELPPLPAASLPKLAAKEPVRARGSSTADLATFLRSSGPPQMMDPVNELGSILDLPTAEARATSSTRRRSQTLNGLGIVDRPPSTSTYGTMLDNYYSTITHEAPVDRRRSVESSDGLEEIATPSKSPLPQRPTNPPSALQRGDSTGGDSWHTTRSSATERRANFVPTWSPTVPAPQHARGQGPASGLVRKASVASVRSTSQLSIGGGGLSPTASRRMSRKPAPSPDAVDLNASQSSESSFGDRPSISAATMAALEQLQLQVSPKSPTPVIAEEPDLDAPTATPRPSKATAIIVDPRQPAMVTRVPSPGATPTHASTHSSLDATNLAAQSTRPTSIHLNNLPMPADPSRLSDQLEEAERALLRSRPSSPPPNEPLPAPPRGSSPTSPMRPPRESSLPRHASLSVESARLLATHGPTSKANKRKSTMRLTAGGPSELTFSAPAPSVDNFAHSVLDESFASSLVDPTLGKVARASSPARPAGLVGALAALQAAMKETAEIGLGGEGDAVTAMLPVLRGLQVQFSLAATLVGQVIAAASPESSVSSGIPPLERSEQVVSPEQLHDAPADRPCIGSLPVVGETHLPYAGVSELSDHESSMGGHSDLDDEDGVDVETDASIERAEVVLRTPTTPNMRLSHGEA